MRTKEKGFVQVAGKVLVLETTFGTGKMAGASECQKTLPMGESSLLELGMFVQVATN
jgi:hypothetical protein